MMFNTIIVVKHTSLKENITFFQSFFAESAQRAIELCLLSNWNHSIISLKIKARYMNDYEKVL